MKTSKYSAVSTQRLALWGVGMDVAMAMSLKKNMPKRRKEKFLMKKGRYE